MTIGTARLPAAVLFLVAAVLFATHPPSAHADHHDLDIPWPELLPPGTAPADVKPHPVKNCRRASVRCVDGLVRRLRAQWRGYHATCDHRAVIAYSYLQITKGLRDDLARPADDPDRIVEYRRWMIYLITAFSNMYSAAFRDWDAGRPVADAWRITFETAADGDFSAGQDVLLFSNAHVQHDLPFVIVQMGLVDPNGDSRKPDHDAVNIINTRVFDPIQDFTSAHYDPTFSLIDLQPLPVDEIGTLELVKSWREGAWRSAERLANADTAAEQAEVVDSIRSTSTFWAELISSVEVDGMRETRDTWCAAHQSLP
jgi:hypothetical protein